MFERIKHFLFNTVRFEGIVLFMYLIKCLIVSVSFQDSILLTALVGLNAFKTYNNRFEIKDSLDEKYKTEVKDELKDIKQTLSVLKIGAPPRQQQENGKRYF
jgi:hypothetical protein